MRRMVSQGIGLSVISLAELYDGVASCSSPASEAKAVQNLLGTVELVPLDESACRIFGEQRAKLRRSGYQIGDMDILIGATALARGLILLTNNTGHFERMADLRIVSS